MKNIFYLLFVLLILIGCNGGSSAHKLEKDLGPEIVDDICLEFNIDRRYMQLEEFSVIHEGDNKYSGLLTTVYNGYVQTYDVGIVYDGDDYQYTWEWIDEDLAD